MKEFNDFIQYAKEHINEIQYDTVSSLQNEWNQGLTLSKEDVFINGFNRRNNAVVNTLLNFSVIFDRFV